MLSISLSGGNVPFIAPTVQTPTSTNHSCAGVVGGGHGATANALRSALFQVDASQGCATDITGLTIRVCEVLMGAVGERVDHQQYRPGTLANPLAHEPPGGMVVNT